jgi:spermidine/putrescine-binding protein
MRTRTILALAAAGAVLAACGGGSSSHATCKDEKSTTDYFLAWQKKMTDAATSGKVTPDKAAGLAAKMGDMQKKMEEAAKKNDYGAACTALDEMSKELGI